MPEEFLNGPYVVTVLQEVRGKRMTEGVTRGGLIDTGPSYRMPHRLLNRGLVQMVSPGFAGLTIDVT
jgi:hypothetical protein